MIAEGLVAALRERGQTIAVAESLTAGLLGATIAQVPGASAVLRGGLIVYATDLKSKLAGVDEELLAVHGPVHPDVASQLAQGARERCYSDWGVGLTGVAGPGPQDGIEAGTVYIGLSGPGRFDAVHHRFSGDRENVRQEAVRAAIQIVTFALG
ncbi:CinA family protein [Pseudonocardiaceae bacterium YIM PH 21723]|nr:CinA family protein [Pseudonocardiaceae bacterium YIM PH 21723]